MHGTATLGEFLEDGELLGDVTHGVHRQVDGGKRNLSDIPFFATSAPMTRYFGDAHA